MAEQAPFYWFAMLGYDMRTYGIMSMNRHNESTIIGKMLISFIRIVICTKSSQIFQIKFACISKYEWKSK